jgi:hypothetical protein
VALDYGTGLCTIDTPKAQGACGFLKKAGEVKLGDVTLRSGNEYAAVTVVALDDRPIRESKKLLVQVGTPARLSGWQSRSATFAGDKKKQIVGFEIVATGKPPWRMVAADVTLTVNNPGLKSATALSTSGYPAGKVDGEQSGGRLTLKLPAEALYLVLEP